MLIEIGAAFVLYERRVVLVWDKRIPVPSNLQGLYRCEFEGDELTWRAGMRLMKAIQQFKQELESKDIRAPLPRLRALAPRREVIEVVVAGLDTRSLAGRLSISGHTVQDHLKSVFEKLGIHSRRALLAKLGATAGGA